MNRRITVAGYCVALACAVFGTPVQSAQPIQVLTVDQLNQLDKDSASSVPQGTVKHRQRAHRNVSEDASKYAVRPAGSHKVESGDPIAAFAGDVSGHGRSSYGRRGKADAVSSGVTAGYYRVNFGDTVVHIATAFGQQPKDLMSWNSLSSNSVIQPGQVLRVGPLDEGRARGPVR